LTEEEKDKLANEHINLAHYFARKYSYMPFEYEDLLSTALFGFTKALNAFDPSRGIKFTTLAGRAIQSEMYKFNRDKNAGKRKGKNVSLNQVVYYGTDGSEITLMDMLTDETEQTDWKGINKAIDQALQFMKEREKKAFILYSAGKTQREVSEELGISQMQVSRLVRKAFQRVKNEYWESVA